MALVNFIPTYILVEVELLMNSVLGNSTLGNIINTMSTNYTGSGEMTIFIIMIMFAALLIGFAISIDLIMLLMVPLAIVGYIMYPTSVFGPIMGIILAYIAVLFAKRFIMNT